MEALVLVDAEIKTMPSVKEIVINVWHSNHLPNGILREKVQELGWIERIDSPRIDEELLRRYQNEMIVCMAYPLPDEDDADF